VVEGEKAKARNPYLLVYFKVIEAKRAAMRELGFTPSARVGLPTDDSRDGDPEDERWRRLLELAERGKAERALFIKRSKQRKVKVAAEDTALIEVPPASSQPQ
jgi:hypothetical protein